METYILALDQGTTSSRAVVFDRSGNIISIAQKEFPQIFPKPGWVEHNPMDILETQLHSAKHVLEKASIKPEQIASIGITNQRETITLWDRNTGKPVYNSIVWQCRRTSEICESLEKKGYGKIVREKTGLLLDPYFSGTKIKWLFDNVPGLYERAEKGEICAGTIDTWLLFNLTGKHFTDPSNASRTLLFDISTGKWDKELLDMLGIPARILPEIKPSCGFFASTKKEIFGREIPVGGIAGDQQASLFGQACFDFGSAKNTYGTGCFMLVNTGKKPVFSSNRLLSTVAWDIGDGMEYALEGSVFIGGAVIQWLRDQMKLVKTAADSEREALSVKDNGGVYFIPAFVGLGAPYWDPEAKGTIMGLTRGSGSAHIIRAALESIAFQSLDLIDAIKDDIGGKITSLKVDGGASVNSFLMQFQSDILGIPVIQSSIAETTALGAAYLAGLHCGYWNDKDDIRKNWKARKTFTPALDPYEREAMTANWHQAVRAALQFKP
ncbi:MAG: glycerol kinase [Lentisphaerae bacterium GWF2_44_16]|nr:MAG: glycerol kinase [Lentisphaerae bacterium GWF2_44_16]